MKKILLIFAIVMTGIGSAMAQTEKGEMGAGLNLLYGTEVQNLGVGAKFRYALSDEFRAEAAIDYLFKHDHTSMLDANINFEYILPVEGSDFITYPILGVGFGNKHKCHTTELKDNESVLVEKKHNNGIVGINAGWGAEYAITDKASVTLEAQYQFFNHNSTQLLIGIGLVHKF